jgi:hypothetical protein
MNAVFSFRGIFMSKSRESFVRLAENRTRRALKDIRLIGNLSNRSNYAWTTDDVSKIFAALDREIRETRQRFKDEERTTQDIDFSLEK